MNPTVLILFFGTLTLMVIGSYFVGHHSGQRRVLERIAIERAETLQEKEEIREDVDDLTTDELYQEALKAVRNRP